MSLPLPERVVGSAFGTWGPRTLRRRRAARLAGSSGLCPGSLRTCRKRPPRPWCGCLAGGSPHRSGSHYCPRGRGSLLRTSPHRGAFWNHTLRTTQGPTGTTQNRTESHTAQFPQHSTGHSNLPTTCISTTREQTTHSPRVKPQTSRGYSHCILEKFSAGPSLLLQLLVFSSPRLLFTGALRARGVIAHPALPSTSEILKK